MTELKRMPLAPEEICTLALFTDQYRTAQVQAEVVQKLNQQYIDLLREKYSLDGSWVCLDGHEGFIQAEKVES